MMYLMHSKRKKYELFLIFNEETNTCTHYCESINEVLIELFNNNLWTFRSNLNDLYNDGFKPLMKKKNMSVNSVHEELPELFI